MTREEIRKENTMIRGIAFRLAAEYGIDTPVSRSKQAEFTWQLREVSRAGGFDGDR